MVPNEGGFPGILPDARWRLAGASIAAAKEARLAMMTVEYLCACAAFAFLALVVMGVL